MAIVCLLCAYLEAITFFCFVFNEKKFLYVAPAGLGLSVYQDQADTETIELCLLLPPQMMWLNSWATMSGPNFSNIPAPSPILPD